MYRATICEHVPRITALLITLHRAFADLASGRVAWRAAREGCASAAAIVDGLVGAVVKVLPTVLGGRIDRVAFAAEVSDLFPRVRQVSENEALDRTRRDYDEVAELYDDMVRRHDDVTEALPTAMINAFADLVRAGGSAGAVVDAGCGPGQWTDHLDKAGIRAYGIDLSPAMVAIARRYRPDLRYEVGSMLHLDAEDESIAGILAHFSLIHTPPDLLPRVLTEFARVVEPGGPLLIGVQITDTADANGWVPYDHKASPAYRWTLDALAVRLHEHDFAELGRLRIVAPAPGKPPAGYLLARHGARGSG